MDGLISIIIPVYNNEKYIGACLESVLGQTYLQWEALVVDDGSTDRSYDICKDYANKDVRIRIFSQKNLRVGAARNNGLDHAKGEYIMFLDSDDMLEPDAMETAMKVLQRTDADMVQWEAYMFSDVADCPHDIGRIGKRVEKYGTAEVAHCECVKDRKEALLVVLDAKGYGRDVRFRMLWNSCRCVWTKLSRATVFEQLRFPEDLEYEDDYIVHQMFWNASKTTFINDELTNKRNHQTSVLHTMSWKGQFDHLETSFQRLLFVQDEVFSKEYRTYASHDHFVSLLNLDAMCRRKLYGKERKDYLNHVLVRTRNDYCKYKKDLCVLDRLIVGSYVKWPTGVGAIYTKYRTYRG